MSEPSEMESLRLSQARCSKPLLRSGVSSRILRTAVRNAVLRELLDVLIKTLIWCSPTSAFELGIVSRSGTLPNEEEESESLSEFLKSSKMWRVSAKMSSGPTAVAVGVVVGSALGWAALGSAASDSVEDSSVSTLGCCSSCEFSLLEGLRTRER